MNDATMDRRNGKKGSLGRRYTSAAVACLLMIPGCGGYDGGVVPFKEPSEGSLDEADIPPATSEQQSLVPKAKNLPKNLTMGETLSYIVELHNPTKDAISLDPCPGYYQAWGESGTAVFAPGVLNCEDAPGEIGPGETVSFEMEIDIAESIDGADCFSGSVFWYLGSSGESSESTGSDFIRACVPEAQERASG